MKPAYGRNEACPCGSGKKYKKCCESSGGPDDDQLRILTSLLAAGRNAELETSARTLADRYPLSGIVWKILGLALWRQGKDPLAALQKAADNLPQDAEAASNLGNALRAAGKPLEAIAAHRRALKIAPHYAEAHNNIGTALLDLSRLEEACDSFAAATQIKPGFGVAHANLAAALGRAGRWPDAAASWQRAVGLDPLRAELHAGLADALRNSGEHEKAVESYRQALAMAPTRVEVLLPMAAALRDLGRMEDAEQYLRSALELQPAAAEVHFNLAVLLRLQNRAKEAVGSCLRALELKPALLAAMVLLAKLRADDGEFAAAESLLEDAIARDGDCAEAWSLFPAIKIMTRQDMRWAQAAARLAGSGLPPRREVHLRYALGKYCDDIGEFAEAFSHYRRANMLSAGYAPRHEKRRLTQFVDEVAQARYSPGAAKPPQTAPLPVFIVGMPRSGTSLTEQILASHPNVFGAGELPFWGGALSRWLSIHSPQQKEQMLRDLGEEYRDQIRGAAPDARCVIDKMPSNFLCVGLIRAALPDARIIHIRRDPIDTCLSMYFQDFETAYSYANDLDNLAHAYEEYRRIMEHWRSYSGAELLLEVSYETLIENQSEWTRRMLDFIDLSFDEACLNFHTTRRTVASVSGWQVRQALNRASIGRWRKYADFLGPLRRLAPD